MQTTFWECSFWHWCDDVKRECVDGSAALQDWAKCHQFPLMTLTVAAIVGLAVYALVKLVKR